MSELDELKTLIDDLTDDLVGLEPDPESWARWVVYLLEVLESKTQDPAERESFIRAVMDACDGRLEWGRW